MGSSPTKSAPADPWSPYVPTRGAPWNLARVVHLHRRAGFAATWSEIQRDLRDRPQASVTLPNANHPPIKANVEPRAPAEKGRT